MQLFHGFMCNCLRRRLQLVKKTFSEPRTGTHVWATRADLLTSHRMRSFDVLQLLTCWPMRRCDVDAAAPESGVWDATRVACGATEMRLLGLHRSAYPTKKRNNMVTEIMVAHQLPSMFPLLMMVINTFDDLRDVARQFRDVGRTNIRCAQSAFPHVDIGLSHFLHHNRPVQTTLSRSQLSAQPTSLT